MNLNQYLAILRARWVVIFFTLLLTVGLTAVASLLLTKTWKATTSLVLNFKGVDPITGVPVPSQLMPGYMATQIDIINSQRIALEVIDQLKLAEGDAVMQKFMDEADGEGEIRNWLAELLLKNLEVKPSRESSVLEISFKAVDPQFAAMLANAFAAAYQKVSIQLKAEPSRKASGYFADQVKGLRERLEQAQKRLSEYQGKHGIFDAESRLDVESARLAELSSQLVVAQAQAMEATSRQRQAQGGAASSPDVMSNALVQNLRASLAMAEAKFADTAQKLDKNHPQYQAARSEVEKLRSSLDENIRIATNSVAGNARILQQREAEIRASVAAQKSKVIELNGARDELKLLTQEMESARRAYEGASQRLNQTSLEGQSDQADIALLNPATVPVKPYSPRLLLNLLISFVAGIVLGIGFGFLAEIMSRRVRSADDLSATLKVPVLGTIDWRDSEGRFGGTFSSKIELA